MNDINNVTLLGNIVRDAELKMSTNGFAILRFTVAVNKTVKINNEYKKNTSFFDVVIFGKYAESLVSICTKGKKVAITGELSQNKWTSKDGKAMSRVEIHASSVFVFTKEATASDFTKEDNEAIQAHEPFIDDIPF